MSLLWNTAVRHEAMPWNQNQLGTGHHPVVHSTKKGGPSGFAGYVGDSEYDNDLREDTGDEDGFDEDLYDESTPDPTEEEERHYEEHGDYPDSHYERHDQAYQKALQKRKQQEHPDYDDPDLMKFVREHGSNTSLWKKHGEYKPIDLKRQPVYATQPYVSQKHIDKYKSDPHAPTAHVQQYGHNVEYLGDEAPMFVTSNGDLHVTEGHHRVAAALQRGDTHIHGWHYNLDEDPADIRGRDEDEYYNEDD